VTRSSHLLPLLLLLSLPLSGCAAGLAKYSVEYALVGDPPAMQKVGESCQVQGISIGPGTIAANFALTQYDQPTPDGKNDATGSTLSGCGGLQGAHPAAGFWVSLLAGISAVGAIAVLILPAL